MRLNKLTLIIIGVILLFTIFHFWGWPFLNGKIFLPFRSIFGFVDNQIDSSTQATISRDDLIKENKELSSKINALTLENIKIKLLEEENQKLRKELNFSSKISNQTVLANVIGQKDEAGMSWFIVDRGSDDGIEEGVVATSEGIVVGKVMKVTGNRSYLLSLLNERTRLAVEIVAPPDRPAKENQVNGIIEGKSGLAVELKLIPIDKKIENDDWVITSGLEYNVPRGLFIGSLKDVKSKPTDLFFKAMVDVPFKLDNLQMVNIIIPKK